MCQLIRFRVSHRAAFAEARSRIPGELWGTAHDDRARGGEPGTLWATLAALDVMRERGIALEPIESLEAELIPVFYGPGATVHAKLMAADLRCCTLAAGA